MGASLVLPVTPTVMVCAAAGLCVASNRALAPAFTHSNRALAPVFVRNCALAPAFRNRTGNASKASAMVAIKGWLLKTGLRALRTRCAEPLLQPPRQHVEAVLAPKQL